MGPTPAVYFIFCEGLGDRSASLVSHYIDHTIFELTIVNYKGTLPHSSLILKNCFPMLAG